MRSFFKGFLRCSDREYRGSMAFAVVTILLLIALKLVPVWIQREPLVVVQPTVPAPSPVQAVSIEHELNPEPSKSGHQRFRFNPNDLPIESWEALGLSLKQAQSIHRYEAAGGSFRVKRDVLKLYVVDEEQYAEWEEFIDLPEELKAEMDVATGAGIDTETETETETRTGRARSSALVNLNIADSAALTAVRGIGTYTARQIVWYRDKLGGFVSMEQLGEVKGIRPENLERILGQTTLSKSEVTQLAVNICDVQALGRHPYCSWEQARAIVAYRDAHGPFNQIEDLLLIHLIDSADIVRMQPYLDFE